MSILITFLAYCTMVTFSPIFTVIRFINVDASFRVLILAVCSQRRGYCGTRFQSCYHFKVW